MTTLSNKKAMKIFSSSSTNHFWIDIRQSIDLKNDWPMSDWFSMLQTYTKQKHSIRHTFNDCPLKSGQWFKMNLLWNFGPIFKKKIHQSNWNNRNINEAWNKTKRNKIQNTKIQIGFSNSSKWPVPVTNFINHLLSSMMMMIMMFQWKYTFIMINQSCPRKNNRSEICKWTTTTTKTSRQSI